MVRLWHVVVASLSVLCVLIEAQTECRQKISCSQCIQTPNCMWCGLSGNFTDEDGKSLTRCIRRTDEEVSVWREACGIRFINEPTNFFEPVEDIALTQAGVLAGSGSSGGTAGSSGSESGQTVVQIKPQRVSMKLRAEESYSMDVIFRQAEDYPVDLYYLMDLSKSMEDDKESLSLLGAQLADEMQKITRNFRLGFGSFVDKVVMPYVSTVPDKLKHPCTGCAPPYGFKNALPLTEDALSFANEVAMAPVSGNLDAPEGGFDAIMQAIVCQEEIKWRQEARRLLVFSTDAGFHYAGDGKLGGIVKPNDGQCHLDLAHEYYTYSSLQDYPSVSQINQVAKEHKMNIIFAVTAEQSTVYSSLAQIIEGSGQGELTANSSNVVELVKREYNKISSKVELKDNATGPVTIRYFSKCKSSPTEKETNVCQGLKVGDQVTFRTEITVERCPKDPSEWRQIIGIYPVGLRESLIIDLEMICDCPCENKGNEGHIENAEQCSGNGTYMCGVCSCYEGFLGSRCECGANTKWGAEGTFDDSTCRETNTSAVCSGRGTCTCGECQCNTRDNGEIVDGPFCQCTNFLCNRFNGVLCGGPDHGECKCNKCECKSDWTGPACMCEKSVEDCLNPATGEMCSNRGKCECNRCKCSGDLDGRYSGKWCEDCPACKGKCEPYRDCVQCLFFESGKLTPEECEANCTELFNATEVPIAVEKEGERLCSFFDEKDCRFKFVYGYDENKEPYVRVQETLECPPTLDLLAIVLGVIGAIVAVGVALLLMWKVLTTIHDRREFARFEKERMMARWDTGENPIYKQATSTFKNPMYGGK